MREDIIAGLKNALARGESLEKAIQSFINAGYNPIEVKQAAESLTQGAMSISNPETERARLPMPAPPQIPQQIPQQFQNPSQVAYPKRLSDIRQTPVIKTGSGKRTFLIIFLILMLLLLIGGLIFMIFYGQELLDKILN